MFLSSALDSALTCQLDTRGMVHKFAIKEYACDICESHTCADKKSNYLGYYTMSAGKHLPMSLTRVFRIFQSERSTHATIIIGHII